MNPRSRARLLLALARTRAALLRALFGLLRRLLPSFSISGVCALADTLASALWLFDRRGRRVGRENLDAVYGASKSARDKARLLRASYRNALRSELALFHFQPLSAARYRRFVRVDPADLERYEAFTRVGTPVVLVSAHFANWEMLLLGRSTLAFAPPFAYLVESTGIPELDTTLERLRDHGGRGSAQRKRGSLALRQALAQGKSVSLMLDRHLWGNFGGVYAPFLGLEARTTPLGALLARSYGVPLAVILLLPERDLRWRLWISQDMLSAPTPDAAEDVRGALVRANQVLSEAILRHPEVWLWNIKRFKSRPSEAQGRYPAYSQHDPAPDPAP